MELKKSIEMEILSVEDLLNMEVEEDNFMFEETSLCTVCSWTSSQQV